MTLTDRVDLRALLAQMETFHDTLDGYDAGVCLLHLDAAIAALDRRLRDPAGPQVQFVRATPAAAS